MDQDLYESLYRLEDSHWWFRGRRAVIRALLNRVELPASPRVLDAGCGTGRNLLDLVNLGEASGIDASPEAVEFCRQRGLTGVVQGDLSALPFDQGEFGVLLMADVVEHLDDDVGGLRELRRVAAPGAALVVTTPAYPSLWSHHDESHHHYRRYRRPELEARARAAGWDPVFSTYFNAALLVPIAVVRRLARRRASRKSDLDRTPSALNALLALPMQAEARLIAIGARLPFGLSIGMVCRPGEVPELRPQALRDHAEAPTAARHASAETVR